MPWKYVQVWQNRGGQGWAGAPLRFWQFSQPYLNWGQLCPLIITCPPPHPRKFSDLPLSLNNTENMYLYQIVPIRLNLFSTKFSVFLKNLATKHLGRFEYIPQFYKFKIIFDLFSASNLKSN